MKKIFPLLFGLFIVSQAFCQYPGFVAPTIRKEHRPYMESLHPDALKKVLEINDLTMLFPGNWENREDAGLYWWGEETGYVFGTNLRDETGYGQKFIVDGSYQIHGAYFWIGSLIGTTGNVIFTVWDWDDASGGPGDAIAIKSVPMADIKASRTFEPDPDYEDSAGDPWPQPGAFYVEFDEPVEVTDDYLIGADLTGLDAWVNDAYELGNYSSSIDDGGNLTLAWVWGKDGWYSTESIGYSLDIAIFPLIDAITLNLHQLTLIAEPAEGGSVEGTGEYPGGSVVTVSTEPDMPDYGFHHWEDAQGSILSFRSQYAFIMPSEDFSLTAVFQEVVFAGGTGTLADPWQIATPEHLNCVRYFFGEEYHDQHFEQINDINLDMAPYNENEGWDPIGVYGDDGFSGTYNGNGHTIEGLYINRPAHDDQGLFGFAYQADISNLGLTGVDITGNDYVGGLVGFCYQSEISNSFSTGSVSGQSYIGGLIGGLRESVNLAYCHSTGEVNAEGNWVGGLAGLVMDNSSISQCFSASNVCASGYSAGGLSGTIEYDCTIRNSYATGNVHGLQWVGGMTGWVDQSTITNSYSLGSVSSELGTNTGGFVGNGVDMEVIHSYWNTETSGMSESVVGEGKTSVEMINRSTYTDWDFESIWSIVGNESYPYLQWQGGPGAFNYPAGLFELTLVVSPEGYGRVAGEGSKVAGGQVPVSAAANYGYRFVKWTVEGGGTIITDPDFNYTMPAENVTLTANFKIDEDAVFFRTITDIDGNDYRTIIIGNQEWMAENLRTTRYKDGSTIAGISVQPHMDAYGISSEAEMAAVYGRLYDWYAVDHSSGLCPDGWHVPSHDEWTQLTDYLVDNYADVEWNNLGTKLRSCWQVDSPLNGDCARRMHPRWDYDDTYYGTDDFGFSALPGGSRSTSSDSFDGLGSKASWWTSTDASTHVWGRGISKDIGGMGIVSAYFKTLRFSVRCIREVSGYILTLKVDPAGAGSVLGAGDYREGDQVSLTAAANEGYTFICWKDHQESEVSDQQSFGYTMPGHNEILTAYFETSPTGMRTGETGRIKVYPNPAVEELWIELNHPGNEEMVIVLQNLQGQTVKQLPLIETGTLRIRMDTHDLPPGVYLLSVPEEHVHPVKKVIIGH
jgi:uncharacterized protein (TIGR02145 family)/uncharacterized repeat protein (TIGR02543 family)